MLSFSLDIKATVHMEGTAVLFLRTVFSVLVLSFHKSFLESFPDYKIYDKRLPHLKSPLELTPRKNIKIFNKYPWRLFEVLRYQRNIKAYIFCKLFARSFYVLSSYLKHYAPHCLLRCCKDT